jgi:dTDP-4-dehydrorhamnose reductase
VIKYVESIKPDLVINCAAYNFVDKAEENEEEAFHINAMGAKHIAVATQKMNIPMVHISSDYIFDGKKGKAYHEYDHPNPISVYGRSKLAGEQEVRYHNQRSYIVRTAWIFYEEGSNFLKNICRYADQPDVRIVRDQIGSPTYAGHLAEAIMQLVATGNYGVYHLAAQGQASWYELTKLFFSLIESETKVIPISSAELGRRAQRPAFSVLKTIQDPLIELPSWQEGLQEFVKMTKNTLVIGKGEEE